MSEQIAPTTATLSAQALTLVSREIRTRQETAQRAQTSKRRSSRADRQNQAEAVQKQQERLSNRVDQLVQRKKAVSSRISSAAVSPPQRTVLVSRANDLQRQVNQLDGIIGGEGQGDQSNAAVLTSKPQAITAAFKPQAAAAIFAPRRLRSAPAQQQPATGALRAFAKNSPATAPARVEFAEPSKAASSQVDLIA
ncbi:MAG: hypothetical protein HYW07_01995 [Candidatus Latescibacteria bacterium]|nr:hypothetical protein [Candidatus Latescibacterota bacterium]